MTTKHKKPYVWDEGDTERMGLEELPLIQWDPPPMWNKIPVGEPRELFGKAGIVQWELANKLWRGG